MKRSIGVALLVVGTVLLFWGVNASESFGSELSRIFRGTPTDRTIWLLAGGAAAGIAGLALVLGKRSD